MKVNGILLLYHHPLGHNAPTIMEHVNAFERHSRFQIWNVNTELGFPKELKQLEFEGVVLHYSLFGTANYMLNAEFLDYLSCLRAYKVAFFQDEYHHCRQRFDFLNRYQIDCVFTLVESVYWKDVYQKYTRVPNLVYQLTGYVSNALVEHAARLTMPDAQRKIDIGYRGRNLLGYYYMGKGVREKVEIAAGFRERAQELGLKLDIEHEERKRIYGWRWYQFLANCRAVLGVEAGVSIFDVQDVVQTECTRLLAENPSLNFEEISQKFLYQWEGNIPHRVISPRHFEAAALRVCQILFEGNYSGILKPMVHYIPLKKDWSNFDEVIRMFRDTALRQELTENAYRDLIASGQYSYQKFIAGFDQVLLDAGLQLGVPEANALRVTARLSQGQTRRQAFALVRGVPHYPFPGRRFVTPTIKRVQSLYRRWKQLAATNQVSQGEKIS